MLFQKGGTPFVPFLYSWYDDDSNFKWKEEVTMNTFMKKLMMLSLIGLSVVGSVEAAAGRRGKPVVREEKPAVDEKQAPSAPVVQEPVLPKFGPKTFEQAHIDGEIIYSAETLQEAVANGYKEMSDTNPVTSGFAALGLAGYAGYQNSVWIAQNPGYTSALATGLFATWYVLHNKHLIEKAHNAMNALTWDGFVEARRLEGWGTRGISGYVANTFDAISNTSAEAIVTTTASYIGNHIFETAFLGLVAWNTLAAKTQK